MQDAEIAFFKILGANVKNVRAAANLTQEDLCGIIEMERTYLSEIENGRANPSFGMILKIATALNTSVSALCKGA